MELDEEVVTVLPTVYDEVVSCYYHQQGFIQRGDLGISPPTYSPSPVEI